MASPYEDEVRRRMGTAERFRRELANLDPEQVPNATVHSAYYAMFHAATSVIFVHGGRVTKTHSGLIVRFFAILRMHHPNQLDLVARLGRAFDERLRADYDDGGSDAVLRAHYLQTDASSYVAACRALLGP